MAAVKTDKPRLAWGPYALGALLVLLTFFYTGWLAEDAYIVFRVVDNLLDGRGLVWNSGERVQVFTSPLWLFIVSFFSASIFVSAPIAAFAASFLCGIVVVSTAIFMGARRPRTLVCVLLILFTCRAFLDYSSSGLENPLLHALSALACLLVYRSDRLSAFLAVFLAAVLASLLMMTRLDAALIGLPVLLHILAFRYRELGLVKALAAMTIGALPIVCWEIFSLFYFGSLFPNTAFAKIPIGYPKSDLFQKGFTLIRATAILDPIAMLSVVLVPLMLVLRASRLRYLSIAASSMTIAYVIYVGGDYMLGRFFSSLFVFSWLIFLADLCSEPDQAHSASRSKIVSAVLAVLIAVSLWSLAQQVARGGFDPDYRFQPFYQGQVADERSAYQNFTGIRAMLRGRIHPWLQEGQSARQALGGRKALVAKRNVGMFAYSAGPGVYIIDILSIANPFLARLPACMSTRAGHFGRPMPDGYVESFLRGDTNLPDPLLANLLRDVTLVSWAPLLSTDRLSAIWRLNTGKYSDPVSLQAYAVRPGGVTNIGFDAGDEHTACPTHVLNGARTDLLSIWEGETEPPWQRIGTYDLNR